MSNNMIRVHQGVTKEQFWPVYRKLKRGTATREQFELDWEEFVEHKRRHQEAEDAAESN